MTPVALPVVPVPLADLTTLRLGGPATDVVVARTPVELIEAVGAADREGAPLLLVRGGSNLVAADVGWPGRTVLVRTTGVAGQDEDDRVRLRVAAGEPWDLLVERTVADGLSGLETMSGIPGLTGATPVQNVGAYGAEIADVLTSVTVYDRAEGTTRGWTPAECSFGFRTSAFKHNDRFVIVDVTVRLARRRWSVPIRYAELARRLGIEPGEPAPLAQVREAVLELRRGKGMLLDAADHDTWSVGSFFVNPFVDVVPDAAQECPHWEVDGRIKLSAAWLIEGAGFRRGYGHGSVAISGKHALALTNRGGATTSQLLALAVEIRARVGARVGVRLRPEARLAPHQPAGLGEGEPATDRSASTADQTWGRS